MASPGGILRKNSMYVGINYPWFQCGWDFGDPPRSWIGNRPLELWKKDKVRQIEADFQRFAAQGIFAVRWFILADGTNYGMGACAPHRIRGRWSFDPLPEAHAFHRSLQNDFEAVLRICARTGVKLLPSLIDFYWCHEGRPLDGPDGVVKCGRADIIRDPNKRGAFFDRVFEPLLALSMRYADSVYAWELINEPEWVIRKFWCFLAGRKNRTVSLEEMRAFIVEGMRRINGKTLSNGRPAFASSVGFAHWESLQSWNAEALGIRLPQFHYYAQKNRPLPEAAVISRTGCILGEFATAAAKPWPELRSPHSDQSVRSRLLCIEGKGYPACFLWSARAVDPATRWTEGTQRDLLAYAGGARPGTFPA